MMVARGQVVSLSEGYQYGTSYTVVSRKELVEDEGYSRVSAYMTRHANRMIAMVGHDSLCQQCYGLPVPLGEGKDAAPEPMLPTF